MNEYFEVDSVVSGTVTEVTPFGAFVELAPNLEGLRHISEMADDYSEINPYDLVKKGELRNFRVSAIDRETGRIALSLTSLDDAS